jgi:chromosome segregation ATPase
LLLEEIDHINKIKRLRKGTSKDGSIVAENVPKEIAGDLKKDLTKIETNMTNLKAELEKKDKLSTNMADLLTNRMIDVKKDINKIKTEVRINAMNDDIAGADTSDLNNSIHGVRKEIKQLKEEIKKEKNNQGDEKLSEVTDEIRKLKHQIKENQIKQIEPNELTKLLTVNMSAVKNELAEVKEKVKDTNHEVKKKSPLQSQVEDVRHEVNTVKNALLLEIADRKTAPPDPAIVKLSQNITKVNKELNAIKSTIEEKAEEAKAPNPAIVKLSENVKEVKNDLKGIKKEIKLTADVNIEKMAEVHALLQAKIQTIATEINSLQNRNTNSSEAIKDKIHTMNESISTVNNRLEVLSSHVKDQGPENKTEIQKVTKELQGSLKGITTELNELKENTHENVTEKTKMSKELRKKLADIKVELLWLKDNIKEGLKKPKESTPEEDKKWINKIADLKKEIGDVEDKKTDVKSHKQGPRHKNSQHHGHTKNSELEANQKFFSAKITTKQSNGEGEGYNEDGESDGESEKS